MSTATATAGASKGRRARPRAAAAAAPVEYNLMLTVTLCLLALGAVMVFSASSTTQVLSDGSLANSTYFLKRTVIFGIAGLLRCTERFAPAPPCWIVCANS